MGNKCESHRVQSNVAIQLTVRNILESMGGTRVTQIEIAYNVLGAITMTHSLRWRELGECLCGVG